MNNKILSLLIAIISMVIISACSEDETVAPEPESPYWELQYDGDEILSSVNFTDINNGIVVGWKGTILRTTDGGTTWNKISSGTTYNLSSISFANTNNGLIVGEGGLESEKGIILRTTNGGINWNPVYTGNYNFWAVSFPVANFAIVTGDYRNGMYINNIMRTSTNGGSSWNTLLGTPQDETFVDASFTDLNIGTIVGGSGRIIRTTNGGSSWINQTSGVLTSGGSLLGVCFTGSNNGLAVGSYGAIVKTTNGGNTWIKLSSGTTEEFKAVSFTDSNNGTVVGGAGKILKTTDGGTSWTNQSISTEKSSIDDVYFVDSQNGWIVTGSGRIYRTKN